MRCGASARSYLQSGVCHQTCRQATTRVVRLRRRAALRTPPGHVSCKAITACPAAPLRLSPVASPEDNGGDGDKYQGVPQGNEIGSRTVERTELRSYCQMRLTVAPIVPWCAERQRASVRRPYDTSVLKAKRIMESRHRGVSENAQPPRREQHAGPRQPHPLQDTSNSVASWLHA